MKRCSKRPGWIWLYLVALLMVVLGWAEVRVRMSSTLHRLAEIGILILIYGLVNIWLSANQAALIAPHHTPDPKRARTRFPVGELAGIHGRRDYDTGFPAIQEIPGVGQLTAPERENLEPGPDAPEADVEWVAWGNPASIESQVVGRDE